MVTDAAPRWITPARRAHSRSLAGRPGHRVLPGVMLRSQGIVPTALDSESRVAAHCANWLSKLPRWYIVASMFNKDHEFLGLNPVSDLKLVEIVYRSLNNLSRGLE
ncbi:jg27745 [Pararge aegeria aegeria]|uniref:Jg27745 protein n=1 Tax=Pararge aegeria aegeria TaxID=348720 RepID=A0A8S4S459_9NEOP|nr:jg27745 [Pararge aegeria aegeria]